MNPYGTKRRPDGKGDKKKVIVSISVFSRVVCIYQSRSSLLTAGKWSSLNEKRMFGQKASRQLQTAAGCRYSRSSVCSVCHTLGLIHDKHPTKPKPCREKSAFSVSSHSQSVVFCCVNNAETKSVTPSSFCAVYCSKIILELYHFYLVWGLYSLTYT